MPDIEITCHKCANVVTVSEFADMDGLTCQVCGEPMHRPQMMSLEPQPVTRRLRVRKDLPPGATQQPPEAPAAVPDPQPAPQAQEEDEPTMKRERNLTSWLVFILLAGAMAYWKYWLFFAPLDPALVPKYAALVIVTFHVVITLKAFADAVFQGILCLLIPCYSLYYLFIISDNFMLRAVFAGLLVGIWQEGTAEIWDHVEKCYAVANNFILSGGDTPYPEGID